MAYATQLAGVLTVFPYGHVHSTKKNIVQGELVRRGCSIMPLPRVNPLNLPLFEGVWGCLPGKSNNST